MICPNQPTKSKKKMQAKERDLESISFVIHDGSFPGLSNKAGAVLGLMIALFRVNKSGIVACADSIIRKLSATGYRMSERTFYRALNELQSHGFFNRKKYRVGADKFRTNIIFIENRFKFWESKKSSSSSPAIEPTYEYISPCLPNWQEDPRTKNDHRVTPKDPLKVLNKPRARAGNLKKWRHPVLYSLLCVLIKTKNRDRALILSRARLEIEAERSGVTLAGRSGVEWNRPSWQDMPFYQRERIIADEVLPLLCDKSTLEPREGEDFCAEIADALSVSDITPNFDHRENWVPIQTVQAEIPPPPAPMVLQSDELLILQRAREAMSRRRISG
jgi:hypothetical protein